MPHELRRRCGGWLVCDARVSGVWQLAAAPSTLGPAAPSVSIAADRNDEFRTDHLDLCDVTAAEIWDLVVARIPAVERRFMTEIPLAASRLVGAPPVPKPPRAEQRRARSGPPSVATGERHVSDSRCRHCRAVRSVPPLMRLPKQWGEP